MPVIIFPTSPRRRKRTPVRERERDGRSSGPPDPDAERRRRVRRWTRAILAAGLGSAIAIYFAAGPDSGNPLGYEPLETKQYLHDLELYGGKANVLAAEFREWFTGLWLGRNLAFTVAFLTIFTVLAIRFFARFPPPPPEDEPEIAD